MRHRLRSTLSRHAALALTLAAQLSAFRAGAAGVDFADSVDRDAFVAAALLQHPSLEVAAHRARALAHAGQAEASGPAPELGLEAWNLPLARPWAVGEAGMYMVELRQRFPAAGSREAQALARRAEAEAALDDLAGERMALAQRAVNAFTDYVQAHSEQQLQAQQLQLLAHMEDALRARHTAGAASLSELARLDLEVSRLQRAAARSEAQAASAAALLNTLLGRPPGAPLGAPRTPPAETVAASAEELLSEATQARGDVRAAAARARASAAREAASDAEARLPEFMVGVGYWQDPALRPGLGLTGSMTLPWLSGQALSRRAQAHEEAVSDGAMARATALETQGEVAGLLAQLRGEVAELQLLQRQSLPAAHRAREAVSAAYASGQAGLPDWLESTRSVLELQLEGVTSRASLARILAALDRAVGRSVPRKPLEETP